MSLTSYQLLLPRDVCGEGWNRTTGTRRFKSLLYLLSYRTIFEVKNSSVLLGKTQLVIISDGLSIILLMVNSFLKGTTQYL